MKAQKAILSVILFILRSAILILVITGIYRLGELSYICCYSVVSDVAVDEIPGKDVSVTLDGDMEAKSMARLMERKGLVKNAEIFHIQLKLFQYEDKLKRGSYMLNTSMTPKEMMKIMSGEAEETETEEEE